MTLLRTIHVLGSFRPFLIPLKVYRSENFDINLADAIRSFCNIFGFSLVLLIVILTVLFDVWFCVNHEFRLIEISQAISILLCFLQTFSTYVCILIENCQVSVVIDLIHELVNRSEYIYHFH